jgi:hypothetical protein
MSQCFTAHPFTGTRLATTSSMLKRMRFLAILVPVAPPAIRRPGILDVTSTYFRATCSTPVFTASNDVTRNRYVPGPGATQSKPAR